MKTLATEELIDGILSGNKRLLAKAITLVESKKPEHKVQAEELLKKILPVSYTHLDVYKRQCATFTPSFCKVSV